MKTDPMLHRDFNVPAAKNVVWVALRQLQHARLLQARIQPPAGLTRFSRRESVRTLGIAAAVPIVVTILAPEARAQASDQCTGWPVPCSSTMPCPGALKCANRDGMTCSCG